MDSPVEYYRFLPFLTLVKKEILRFLAVSVQTVLAPIMSSFLYLLVFGVSLGSRISVDPDFSYAQFVVPGLILMSIANNSFANCSSSIFMARYLGSLADLLIAPISSRAFILSYTIAAMLRGFLVGLGVYIVSLFFVSLPWPNPALGILVFGFTSFLFAQFGIVAAVNSDSFETLSLYTNFLILPLIYFGGLFYPVDQLPPVWRSVSQFNPIYYMIEGARYGMLGRSEVPILLSIGVVAFISFVLFVTAAHLIRHSPRFRP